MSLNMSVWVQLGRRSLVLAVLLLAWAPKAACVTKSGEIVEDTYWGPEGSPYKIASPGLFVMEGARLTIFNSVVLCEYQTCLSVRGELNATNCFIGKRTEVRGTNRKDTVAIQHANSDTSSVVDLDNVVIRSVATAVSMMCCNSDQKTFIRRSVIDDVNYGISGYTGIRANSVIENSVVMYSDLGGGEADHSYNNVLFYRNSLASSEERSSFTRCSFIENDVAFKFNSGTLLQDVLFLQNEVSIDNGCCGHQFGAMSQVTFYKNDVAVSTNVGWISGGWTGVNLIKNTVNVKYQAGASTTLNGAYWGESATASSIQSSIERQVGQGRVDVTDVSNSPHCHETFPWQWVDECCPSDMESCERPMSDWIEWAESRAVASIEDIAIGAFVWFDGNGSVGGGSGSEGGDVDGGEGSHADHGSSGNDDSNQAPTVVQMQGSSSDNGRSSSSTLILIISIAGGSALMVIAALMYYVLKVRVRKGQPLNSRTRTPTRDEEEPANSEDGSIPEREEARPSAPVAPPDAANTEGEPLIAVESHRRIFSIPEVPFSEFTMSSNPLASGSYKTVYKAEWEKAKGCRETVAVLVVRSSQDISNEVKTFEKLGRHPNLTRLLATTRCSTGHPGEYQPCFILEFAPLGSLDTVLYGAEDEGRQLLDDVLLTVAMQVCDAMCQLAIHEVIHRDLAARNVLVFQWNDQDRSKTQVKVSDYGLAVHSTSVTTNSCSAGPMRWMAPESIKRRQYTEKSDVWSFGVTLWEIWSHGEVPFATIDDDELVAQKVMAGRRLSRPPDCPTAVFDLISSCFQTSPVSRPSFQKLKIGLQDCLVAIKKGVKDPDEKESLNIDQSCVICLTRDKVIALLPCGHKCLCDSLQCLEAIREVCPICRGKVEGHQRIFDN